MLKPHYPCIWHSEWQSCAIECGRSPSLANCEALLEKDRIGTPLIAGLSYGEDGRPEDKEQGGRLRPGLWVVQRLSSKLLRREP
jgi:hypothetical protein